VGWWLWGRGGSVGECGGSVGECGGSVGECGGSVGECGGSVGECGGSVGECGGSMFGVKWLDVVMWVAQCLGVGSLRECGSSTAGDMIAIIQYAEGRRM
jgi:hypothetical protein